MLLQSYFVFFSSSPAALMIVVQIVVCHASNHVCANIFKLSGMQTNKHHNIYKLIYSNKHNVHIRTCQRSVLDCSLHLLYLILLFQTDILSKLVLTFRVKFNLNITTAHLLFQKTDS